MKPVRESTRLRGQQAPAAQGADAVGQQLAPLADEAAAIARRAARSHVRHLILVWVIRVGFLAAVLGAWQLVAAEKWVNPNVTSYPSAIFIALWKLIQEGSIWTNLWSTVLATIVGFAIGSALGILVAIIFVLIPVIEQALRPLLTGMNSAPRIALAPLFVVWFGLGAEAKIALSVTVVFFIVLANTFVGLTHADRAILLVARSLGYNRIATLWKFVVPGATPVIAAGLQLGLVFSLLGVVASEFIGGTEGIGVLLSFDANTYIMDDFFATLLILILAAVVISQLMTGVERWLLRWHAIEMRGTS
jgi:NitT/TauT family transport system permease protein